MMTEDQWVECVTDALNKSGIRDPKLDWSQFSAEARNLAADLSDAARSNGYRFPLVTRAVVPELL